MFRNPTRVVFVSDERRRSCRPDLASKLMRFIASYGEAAEPLAWTYCAWPLEAAL